MCAMRLGRATLKLDRAPGVLSSASAVGKKEGEGPLKRSFDYIGPDAYFGEKSWEKAESALLKKCFGIACDKAGIAQGDLDYILSGAERLRPGLYSGRRPAQPVRGLGLRPA